MNYTDFRQAVIAAAQAEGLAEYDLYYTAGSATSVTAFEGDIDSFSDTASRGAGFRCIVDGRMGYSNTQKLCAEEAVRLVRDAKAGAQVIEAVGFTRIYSGKDTYARLPQAEADAACDVALLKELALSLDGRAKAIDPRMESSPGAEVEYSLREVALTNSHGLDLHNRQAGYLAFYEATLTHEGRKFIAYALREALTPEGLDLDGMVAEAVRLAVGSIGAASVPSGTYPVVFSPRMMGTLLACFSGAFSADAAQKGLSLLAGKESETIAAPLFTLIDDPHNLDSAGKTPFDDEGVATATKTVVDRGVLNTLLYDLKSAAKAGLASTGNGRRQGFAGDVNVSPFTLCIAPGQDSPEDLLRKAGKGIYITEMKGMHSGSNPVTGDFSLEAKGYVVEDGRLSRPAEQFTVAGNFFQLLGDITAVANDATMGYGVKAPTVLVSGLSIAGEG